MYLEDYLWFLGAIIICLIFSCYASAKINNAFNKYNRVAVSSAMTGYDTAVRLMRANGVFGVAVNKTRGKLTDHYNPKAEVINLSESVYGNYSVAAVAVAAHETGHVMQKHTNYFFFKLRTAICPIVNFGSYLAMPLVLIGLLLDLLSSTGGNIGFYIAMTGVILYGGSLLFALITLPVEFNASRRAEKMLISEGILTKQELRGARQVLSAAALTYVASLLTSLVYFLRFFVRVLTLFGRRNKR